MINTRVKRFGDSTSLYEVIKYLAIKGSDIFDIKANSQWVFFDDFLIYHIFKNTWI